MTRYDELCDTYFEWEPHQEEINRIFRTIPASMRRALIEHLSPPSAHAMLPTLVMGTPTGYIDVYRRGFDENGEKKWERCSDDNCFQLGGDGIRRFIIGMCMTRPQTGQSSMMYFTFSVESVTPDSIELRIENLASQIRIGCRDPDGCR